MDTSNDPLPSQVAAENVDLQSALQFSIKDSQQQYNLQDRAKREYDRECRRAVSASQAEYIAYGRKQLAEEIEFRKTLSLICNNEGQLDKDLHQNRIKMQADMEKSANGDSEIEGENAMLEKVSEQSLLDEQQRLQQIQQQYDAELELALKQSAQLEQPNDNDDEVLKAILATSLLEEEQMKTPEEELLQKAMEQSLKEAEMMNSSEDEFIQKVLARSLEEKDDCEKDDLLEKVIQLSLEEKEMEAMDEETALERAIALSMGNGIEENGKKKSK